MKSSLWRIHSSTRRAASRSSAAKPTTISQFHNWFDESKAFFVDFRHRALRHHAEGIFLSEKIFWCNDYNRDGKQIPVPVYRRTTRQGRPRSNPTAQDWLSQIKPQRWMYGQRLVIEEVGGDDDVGADSRTALAISLNGRCASPFSRKIRRAQTTQADSLRIAILGHL